jgi:YVTN family beta-propeller protein
MHLRLSVSMPWIRLALMALAGTSAAIAQNIYVSNITGGISLVNGLTGAMVGSLPVTGTPSSLALAPLSSGNAGGQPAGNQRLYAAQFTANSVAVVDTVSRALVATIPVGKGPLRIAISPDGLTAYVVNSGSSSVSAISTATNTVVATVPVGSSPTTLVLARDGSRLFVANLLSGTISVIATASNTVTGTWPAAPGINAVAVSVDGETLYAANRTTNQIAVYNAASGSLLQTIDGLSWPDGIAIDPNGDYLYVSNGTGSSVSVLGTASSAYQSPGIVATVAVPAGPTSITISADGSELYVASQRMSSVAVIGTEGKAVLRTLVGLSGPTAVVAAGVGGTTPAPAICSAAAAGLPDLSGTLPALPASCSVPQYPTPASTVTVSTAAELQAALTAAECGQLISVQAGATYAGNFTVPGTPCPPTNPVLVASSAISSLPQYAVPARTLAGGSLFPTLATGNSLPALTISDYATGWYFAGIEFTLTPTAAGVYPIVAAGDYTLTTNALPGYITFDRCQIHPSGTITNYVRGGIDLNIVNAAVIFSNIWGIVNPNIDTQAILVQNSPGPILISGNDLEATGENVLLGTECLATGYAGGGIPDCPVPSDVTVTRNHLIKQASWQNAPAGCNPNVSASCYDIKNTFEIKMGQRVLTDSNWFDTTFLQFQQGTFVIMNCPAAGPYTCADWTVTNNLFAHGSALAVVAGNGNAQTGQRVLFRNNLAVDISGVAWGGLGLSFQIQDTNGFIADHNTIINTPPIFLNGLMFADPLSPLTDTALQWTNNVSYASPSFAGMSPGQTLAALPSPALGGDLFVGDYWPCLFSTCVAAPAYPAGISTVDSTATPMPAQPACNVANKPIAQCEPLDWALVGFEDFAGGDAGTDLPGMALSASSPYKGKGTDGLDIGANVTAVLAAIKGVQ